MLAQLPTPTAEELGGWIVAAAGFAALVYLILSIYGKVRSLQRGARPSDAKLQQRLARYVQRREFTRLERATDRRFRELGVKMNDVGVRIEQLKLEIFREIQENSATLDGKLDRAIEATTRLAAQMETLRA